MAKQQIEARKKELEQSLEQVQNPLKGILQDMERALELNQSFFLDNNVDHEQTLFIPKKQLKKCKSGKNYSPIKVKS